MFKTSLVSMVVAIVLYLGATHYDILSHPALPTLVTRFLEAPMPEGR